jgi:hypothetical protein
MLKQKSWRIAQWRVFDTERACYKQASNSVAVVSWMNENESICGTSAVARCTGQYYHQYVFAKDCLQPPFLSYLLHAPIYHYVTYATATY